MSFKEGSEVSVLSAVFGARIEEVVSVAEDMRRLVDFGVSWRGME